MYEYKMVQIPPGIKLHSTKEKGNEAATYLEKIVNSHAEDGWEFQRIDTLGVATPPGCLSFSTAEKQSTYYIISFRKEKMENDKGSGEVKL